MMLLKYRVPGEETSLSVISDVYQKGNAIYFVPLNSDFCTIKIEDNFGGCLSFILDCLYKDGRFDVTNRSSLTSYVDED